MTARPASAPTRGPLGLWLVGARGAIATTCVFGLDAMAHGRAGTVGLVSELPAFEGLGLAELERFVVGGWEVRDGSLADAGAELAHNGVLSHAIVTAGAEAATDVDARIVPGLAAPGDERASAGARERGALAPRAQVDALIADLAAFRERTGAERVVVVNVASTEPLADASPAGANLAAFEAALDAGELLPPSCLYAYAALRAGCAHVNFTPSAGGTWPALRELAEASGVPQCGSDGKTGETLVKTVLAPLFAHRNLRVLTWQGYNMLGNRDGEVLANPAHKAAKVANKDAALRSLLQGSEGLHTHVGIDYVPSLHDWKTAWDFIHFEGFLGAKMSLQFTWTGSDSALAAPLVLDLARFSELALRDGAAGELAHLACFFKSPMTGGSHDFGAQMAALFHYATTRSAEPATRSH
ncbi:Inositol-3-phosphate synthase [Planctomycetes bacterium Pla163]|uniref:Inositol-3-phosphate synthase n=1 Tax=Rohdeia mirabilis TaxID=2528008 RepID=A0A518CWW8_9BACT|nr:Inositol-3-phosphate synthase [Planctomycetes bacterium Pla163]